MWKTRRSYTYDPLNRLTSVKGLGMVESARQFKNAGQKLAASVLMNLARQSKNPQAQETLLKQAEQLGAALPESATWAFDANGNIASKTLRLPGGVQQARTFTYDEADRLSKLVKAGGPNAGTINLTYDANGNLNSDSTGRQFTWNAQDQLTKVQFPTLSALMDYDPLGRRTTFSKGSSSKTFFYLGQSLLSDGSSRFLQGAGIDQSLQQETSLGSQSYLQDHLGSTSQLVDSLNGNSKARYDYKSYGKLEGDGNNPQASNPFTYTGREDDGTGLLYYRVRYYDPELEVFISQDPLGDAQRYVSGNPIHSIDPFGTYALVDDVTFMSGGALLGTGGLIISDIMNQKMSSDNDYRAAYIGGAAAGEALLYSGPIGAGITGGATTNASRQVLNGHFSNFDWGSLGQETLMGGLLGVVKIPGLNKIPGWTMGRGNYNAIYKQMVTKFEKEQISRVTFPTAQKMFLGKSTVTGMLPGNVLNNLAGSMLTPKELTIKPCYH